jgi:nicotinamidase-related amidase
MTMTAKQAEIDRSALIIVDMQNDFPRHSLQYQ